MTVGELRRFMNTLPLHSDDWPVVVLDGDTGDLFEVQESTRGEIDGGATALILRSTVAD
ncbi:hypothetical protein [Streptomyces sp. NPDC101393]|uniref:hypothetical protein n=1 Tax=Streptomyces sp. NPDC101393 TaxID=3366141 RepID=UPI0038228DF4